jgi:cytochrome c
MRRAPGRRAIALAGLSALVGTALVGPASAPAPALAAPAQALAAPAPGSNGIQYKVLVFTNAAAEKHSSTGAGVAAVRQLATSFASPSR